MNSFSKLCFLFLTAIILFSCSSNSSQTAQQDEVVPIQTLQTNTQEIPVYYQDGLKQYLSKNDDKVHVVNFWATWCGPCVKELPAFEQVNQEMSNELDVTLVSLDFEDKLESALVPFVNKKELKSKVIVILPENEADLMKSVDENWTSGIPATLIYNKHKRYLIQGAISHDDLIEEIEKFIQ